MAPSIVCLSGTFLFICWFKSWDCNIYILVVKIAHSQMFILITDRMVTEQFCMPKFETMLGSNIGMGVSHFLPDNGINFTRNSFPYILTLVCFKHRCNSGDSVWLNWFDSTGLTQPIWLNRFDSWTLGFRKMSLEVTRETVPNRLMHF